MPRQRYPKRQYLDENSELKDQIKELKDVIKAVIEYHNALDFLEVTSRKADQLKVVQQRKTEYLFALEQVEDLLADTATS